MAKTTPIRPHKPSKKRAQSDPIADDNPPVTTDTQPEPSEVSETAPAKESTPIPEKKKGGRPKGSQPNPENPPFFQRVASVPKEDWGTRAFMYVYCTEPICNLKVLGENKYLFRSSQPIHDVQQVMEDYGSMKGYMTLNLRKTGTDATDERDRYHFEIYNPKYPPKIPRRAWLSDPRNDRWAALLPKEEPAPVPGAASTFTDAIKAYGDIRREIRDELEPEPADTRPVDPWTAAEKILQMRSDNPMVEILKQQMADNNKAIEQERQRQFDAAQKALDREAALQAELRKMAATPAAPQKDFLDRLLEVATAADKFEPFKKLVGGLFGGITNGAGSVGSETVVRTARTTGLDVLRDFVTSPVAEKIGAGLGDLFSRMADPPPQPVTIPLTPVANGNGAAAPRVQPAAGETDQQRIIRIAQTITGPMLDEYFDEDEPGDVFAEQVCNMWPADFAFLKGLGPERILTLYRGFAPAWARIGPKEQQFAQFLKQMCEYVPETDDESGVPEDDGIVDLEPDKEKGATA
jgi:hypothetical protein